MSETAHEQADRLRDLAEVDYEPAIQRALLAGAAALEGGEKSALKVLVEAWAVVGEDEEITLEFVRGDAIFPLSVFEDADEAVCSLGDNQCGRIVKVQIVEAPS